jgi:hypothetical protein
MSMGGLTADERYRQHLARFGIHSPGDRLLPMADLDEDGAHFFAYADAGGLRLKAATTPSGLLAGGDEPRGDWHGFLSAMPDAHIAAQRLAWLLTDESPAVHGLPPPPTMALGLGPPPARGIDPARWTEVAPPILARDDRDQVFLTAWMLAGNSQVPERWTVRARADGTAVVTRKPASAGPSALARALALLATGTADEQRWALTAVQGAAAVPAVAAILADLGADPGLRLLAAAALGRLGGPQALAGLAWALSADPESAVRRAVAQALGQLPGEAAGNALAAAYGTEADATVRAYIAQAIRERGPGR